MSQTDKPMHRVSRFSEIITSQESLSITGCGGRHDVVLLGQEEGGQVDAKIKKQGRLDFATRTILKARLSAIDNAEHPQVQSLFIYLIAKAKGRTT